MKIDSIECFLTLAETLNYTEAADRLYVTQSALSRLILQMEDELGVVLFARSRRGVELTAAGESFYNDAIKMLDLYAEGVARAKNAQVGGSGRIRLGCHRNATDPDMIDILEDFTYKYKDIHIDIRSMQTSELVYALHTGTIDCAATSGCPVSEGIEKILLYPYQECIVVSNTHRLAGRSSISMEELRNEPFVTMSRTASARGFDNIIGLSRNAGFEPNVVAEADSVPHLIYLLSKGDAVTILSDNYKYMTWDRFSFIPLEPVSTTNFGFVYNTNNPNPCVKVLAQFVKDNYEYHGEIQPVRKDGK